MRSFTATVVLFYQVISGYFDERTFVSAGSWPSIFISRTARCERRVTVQRDGPAGVDPLTLDGLAEERLRRSRLSRLRLRRKSTVLPALSTARRQRHPFSSRILT